jgi:hypothetical protein
LRGSVNFYKSLLIIYQLAVKELDAIDAALVKVRLSCRLRLKTILTNFLVRKYFQGSFQFDAGAETGDGDQIRRYAEGTDSLNGGRTRTDIEDGDDDSPQSNRYKRARKLPSQSTRIKIEHPQGSSETIPVVEDCKERLIVGDDKACLMFYRRLLTDAQQGLCKKLAKWWIKAINPNKQTNNPYAKGAERKPDWWPMTPPNDAVGEPIKGTLENGFVRHKEPDHLSKQGKNPLHCWHTFEFC